MTHGSTEGGRKAMENILQKADQIDLVYAINEPAAYGGYAALKAAGKEKGVIDRRRRRRLPGRQWVKDGIIGATSQQYPLLMAADGVEAIAEYIKTGKKPAQHRHRREAHHRPSGARRSLDHRRRGHEALLGLISPEVRSLID